MIGYKAMLSDRLPYVVNIALKWCESKGRWVEHVYNTQVKIYVKKSDKDYAVRCVLGIAKRHPEFNFNDTIDWNNLSEDDNSHWKWVSDWVNWFQKSFCDIENIIKTSRLIGMLENDIIKEVCTTYLKNMEQESAEKLAKYILKNIDKRYA